MSFLFGILIGAGGYWAIQNKDVVIAKFNDLIGKN